MIELQGKDDAIVRFAQNYLDLVVSSAKHVAFNYRSVEDLPNVILQISLDKKVESGIKSRAEALYKDPNFNARMEERMRIISQRAMVVGLLKEPFDWILAIIICSITLLPFAHFIHATVSYLEVPLILLIVISNITALVITKEYVWRMLSD